MVLDIEVGSKKEFWFSLKTRENEKVPQRYLLRTKEKNDAGKLQIISYDWIRLNLLVQFYFTST